MGSGKWDSHTYSRSAHTRASHGIDDFDYSSRANRSTPVHPTLDPRRINSKPFKKLESRDSTEHPESNAVFVSFDVTGSNIERARQAQKKLPNLFDLITKYLPHPQVLFAANDDIEVVGNQAIQIGEFESDNRCDEQLRNIILVGEGGGNEHESYDLMLYGAAFKTVLDCYEKRNRKGYFFMYADEPIPTHLNSRDVNQIFGDTTEGKLPINAVIGKLKEQYHVFVLWPASSSYRHSYEQYKSLFGTECAFILQHPDMICEMIGSLIGMTESKADKATLVHNLVEAGTSRHRAEEVVTALAVR